MSRKKQKETGRFRFRDFLVILLCLSAAAVSINLFRIDLFQTFRSLNAKPAGLVITKYNTVQRRMSDRVVWDRLANETPVYPGDLIRIARFSGAVLDIDGSSIELNENTLIRIQAGEGPTRIELASGSLSINSSSEGSSILLNIQGRELTADPGTVLSATSGEDGMVLRVSEGKVSLSVNEKENIKAERGGAISLDTQGNERLEPMAVVTRPKPNANYIKESDGPLNINFAWNRTNMDPGETLRLEIAEDRNFNRISQVSGSLDSTANLSLNTGLWHWRLRYGNLVLSTGRVNIADCRAPEIISPVTNTQFNYRTRPPEIQFRWSEVENATYYLEVANTYDFSSPQISNYVGGTSIVNSSLGPGTWFWRVRPVFPSDYEGNAPYSEIASFSINRSDAMGTPALRSPANNAAINFAPGNKEEIYFSWTSSIQVFSHLIQIAQDESFSQPLIERTLRDNFFTYQKAAGLLEAGQYYWRVFYMDEEGGHGPASLHQSFAITEEQEIKPPVVQTVPQPLPVPVLNAPSPDSLVVSGAGRTIDFNWQPVGGAAYYRFRLYNANDMSRAINEQTSFTEAVQFTVSDQMTEGNYRWTVQAMRSDDQAGLLGTAQFALRILQPVTLTTPAPGASIPGLTALQQATVFRWTGTEQAGSSKFILSRNPNPSQGRPAMEILNPGLSVSIDRLEEGLWYWTVEATTKDGYSISAAPRQLRVATIPLLPLAANRRPAGGTVIREEDLRKMTNMIFNWSAVQGANAYVFSLYHDSGGRRRLISSADTGSRTNWTLDDLRLLDRGTFVWHVEALYKDRSGKTVQRGRVGENTFTIEMELPGSIRPGDPGVLYGN